MTGIAYIITELVYILLCVCISAILVLAGTVLVILLLLYNIDKLPKIKKNHITII